MDNQTLLDLLLSQHRQLREDLASLDGELAKESPNFQIILSGLSRYKDDLAGHLQTEDRLFYPLLLKQLAENQLAIENTKRFIGEMDVISIHVQVFFAQYASLEALSSDPDAFARDFHAMSREILLRISAEEEGVYAYIRLL